MVTMQVDSYTQKMEIFDRLIMTYSTNFRNFYYSFEHFIPRRLFVFLFPIIIFYIIFYFEKILLISVTVYFFCIGPYQINGLVQERRNSIVNALGITSSFH